MYPFSKLGGGVALLVVFFLTACDQSVAPSYNEATRPAQSEAVFGFHGGGAELVKADSTVRVYRLSSANSLYSQAKARRDTSWGKLQAQKLPELESISRAGAASFNGGPLPDPDPRDPGEDLFYYDIPNSDRDIVLSVLDVEEDIVWHEFVDGEILSGDQYVTDYTLYQDAGPAALGDGYVSFSGTVQVYDGDGVPAYTVGYRKGAQSFFTISGIRNKLENVAGCMDGMWKALPFSAQIVHGGACYDCTLGAHDPLGCSICGAGLVYMAVECW